MTAEQLSRQLAKRPEMCQTWVDARMLRDDGGVLYLSKITESTERMGVVHIYLWGRAAMRQSHRVRQAAMELMRTHGLDRLLCEIDAGNGLAIRLAEQVGMKRIGIIRQRKDGRGGRRDVVSMDALQSDLGRQRWAA